MDIKEIALKVGLQAFEEHPYDKGHVVSPSGYTWIDDKLIEFAEALIAELAKQNKPVAEVLSLFPGEPDSYINAGAIGVDPFNTWTFPQPGTKLYTSDQLAAAVIKATGPLEDEVERLTEWEQAVVCECMACDACLDCSDPRKTVKNIREYYFTWGMEEQKAVIETALITELRTQLAAAQEENEQLRSVVFAAESLDKAELGFQVKQLTDQLAKEEQRVAELIGELEHTREQKNLLWFEFSIATQKLAAEQLNNKRLREALQEYIDEHEECQDADDWMAMMCSVEAHHAADEALSLPASTEALDKYVAEKVKEIRGEVERLAEQCRDYAAQGETDQGIIKSDGKEIHYLRNQIATITKQRDLAVYGLNEAEVYITYCKPIEAMREIRKALLAIKESEAK